MSLGGFPGESGRSPMSMPTPTQQLYSIDTLQPESCRDIGFDQVLFKCIVLYMRTPDTSSCFSKKHYQRKTNRLIWEGRLNGTFGSLWLLSRIHNPSSKKRDEQKGSSFYLRFHNLRKKSLRLSGSPFLRMGIEVPSEGDLRQDMEAQLI